METQKQALRAKKSDMIQKKRKKEMQLTERLT